MNKTQETLRVASRAFRIMALGGKFSADDVKLFGDMCALALPMKYRFSKDDLAEQERFARNHSAPSPAQGTPKPPRMSIKDAAMEIIRTLRPADPGSWEANMPYVTERLKSLAGPQNGQGWAELKSLWAALKPHVWERKYDTGRDIETGFERDIMRLGKYIESLPAPPTGDAPTEKK